MKQYNLHSVIFLLGLFLLNACQDESFVRDNEEVIEGIPTNISMSFKVDEGSVISTKSALSDESIVSDLYVFIFTKSGSTWTKEKGLWVDVNTKSFTAEVSSGIKRIYAVANSKGSVFKSADLDSIKNLDQFQELSARMEVGQTSIQRIGSLLMSGAYEPEKAGDGSEIRAEGEINIKPSSSPQYIKSIVLKRVDSRITFDICCEGTESNAEFIPATWKVVNVPRVTWVAGRKIGTDSHDAMDESAIALEDAYFSSEFTSFETVKKNNGKTVGGGFTFYMAENRKEPKKDISSDDVELSPYQYREKQEKNKQDGSDYYVENGKYIYANDAATYVVLTGTYQEMDKNNKPVLRAEVTYTVHLGYVNGDANDYNSERNCTYTYKMKIQGVAKIELEVTSKGEQEDQPGAEGDIVKSQDIRVVDAHYGVDVITFNSKKVTEHASFMVKTIYDTNGEGYSYGEQNTAKDYKWVMFLRNKKEGRKNPKYSRSYQAYPNGDAEGAGGEKLQTIEEVINDLMNKDLKLEDSEGNVTYTVFIDEYFYNTNPFTDAKVSWKEFVNKPNREMHILCNTDYSPDQQSSLTTSSFMISQRSIKTFYNVNDPTLLTAWGVETVNESGSVTATLEIKGTTAYNGRFNMFKYFEIEDPWNNYVNSSDNSVKSNKDKKAYIACLQRNRDIDGNGAIAAKEVKWYLPSVDQMTGIWIGKDGLPSEAHLMPNTGLQGSMPNDAEAYKYHFLTSDAKTFWAEEGSSTSKIGAATDNMYDIRCVRNLGGFDVDVPEEEKYPQNYVIKDLKSNILILTYMNNQSLRTNIASSEFVVENELHTNNTPYKKFQVAKAFVKDGNSNATLTREQIRENKTLCSKYKEEADDVAGAGKWRMPNQREMSLICAYVNDLPLNKGEFVLTHSISSLKTRPAGQYAMERRGDDYLISLSAKLGFVRCVRDLPAN